MLSIVGGIAAFCAAGVGATIACVARVDQISMQLLTTLPAMFGIGAIGLGWAMLRTPSEIGVGSRGIRVVRRRDAQSYEWTQTGWSMIQPGIMGWGRRLRIYDTQGRTLVKLSDSIEDFDELAKLVSANIAAKSDSTAEQLQIRKARRSAVFMGLAAMAFLALAGGVAWMTASDARATRLLAERGLPGKARIEERRLAPDGVTPRLIYRMESADGRSFTRNAEVERAFWDSLEGQKTVEVVYVPDEPSISRLAFGEVEDRDISKRPAVAYGLCVAVGLMSLMFLVAAGLMWRGWDIDFDSQTKRISIKRFGTGS